MSDQFKKAIPYLDKAMQLAETLPEKEKYIYKIHYLESMFYIRPSR